MPNAFTNFLKQVNSGIIGSPKDIKESIAMVTRTAAAPAGAAPAAPVAAPVIAPAAAKKGHAKEKALGIGAAFAAPFVNLGIGFAELARSPYFVIQGNGAEALQSLKNAGTELGKGVGRLVGGAAALGVFVAATAVAAVGAYVAGWGNAIAKNMFDRADEKGPKFDRKGHQKNQGYSFSFSGFCRGLFLSGPFKHGPKAAFNTAKAAVLGAGDAFGPDSNGTTQDVTLTGFFTKGASRVNQDVISRGYKKVHLVTETRKFEGLDDQGSLVVMTPVPHYELSKGGLFTNANRFADQFEKSSKLMRKIVGDKKPAYGEIAPNRQGHTIRQAQRAGNVGASMDSLDSRDDSDSSRDNGIISGAASRLSSSRDSGTESSRERS
jgi:hypothetical protein